MKKERNVKLRKVKNKTAQKNRAWVSFSLYIRLRDCLATTGDREWGICVTCGERKHFKELQAGHAISGRSNAILLDEELVNAQCQRCNNYEGGNHGIYSVWFIKKYGMDKWEEKVRLSKQTKVDIDWDEKTLEYRQKYQELLDNIS